MISEQTLRQLSRDASVPHSSRAAFLRTLKQEAYWRKLRDAYIQVARTKPSDFRRQLRSAEVLLFDCENYENVPGRLVSNPAGSADSIVKSVFHDTDALRIFFERCFNRNSIDGLGMSIMSSVHYSRSYVNAFWTGSQMVFGDGDGLIFKNMTSSDDFVGHEFMHGVTQYSAGVGYEGEAGAINESLSDIFGTIFRQWKRSWDVSHSDWMIGADMMGPVAIQNGWLCLRSLSDPSSTSSLSKQPKHFKDYIFGGGPHENSGILNYAFYLASIAVGGRSWEVVGRIWYATLQNPNMLPDMKLKQFAGLTCHEARRLFPHDYSVSEKLEQAWSAVGLI